MSVEAVGGLGKTDFLNLLATQLRYQDPSNPIENTEFIAQLAQFSALEAAENTNESITALSQQQQKLFAAALIGKTVAGVDSETNTPVSGVVSAVSFAGKQPHVQVGGSCLPLSDILKIQ